MTEVRAIMGDCLDVMPTLDAGSVSLILADLPYGTTGCKWDVAIPFEPLWAQYRQVIKPRGAVVLTASQPFTSMLVMSNPKWFRHSWVWSKGTVGNYQLANVAPLKEHEDVLVFAPAGLPYNPQMVERDRSLDITGWKSLDRKRGSLMRIRDGSRGDRNRVLSHEYPRTILYFNAVAGDCNGAHRLHPTQKPVPLMEYLIRTYSHPGDLVLDNAMGSGTTGVACHNTGRRFIGIEKDSDIFAVAERRIRDHIAGPPMPLFDRPHMPGPVPGRKPREAEEFPLFAETRP